MLLLLGCASDPVPLDPLEGADSVVERPEVGEFLFAHPAFRSATLGTVTSHTASFVVDGWAGLTVTATCGDGEETHSRTVTAEVGIPVTLYGLLSDHDYHCGVATIAQTAEADIRTSPEEHPLPDFEVTGDGAAIDHGYILFNVFVDGIDANEQRAVIVDEEGRIRWEYWLGGSYTGDVDTSWPGDGTVLIGGGYGLRPIDVDLDGNILWQAPVAPTDHNYHHHARRQEDGTVLTMTLHDESYEGTDYDGHWIGAWDEAGDLVWDWSTEEAIDQGFLVPDTDLDDPFHMNSVVPVDFTGCDMLTSMRNADALMCFDHTTGQVAWNLQTDFTLVDDEGNAIADDWPDGQHDPKVEGNRLLVFDNARDITVTVRTRVVEYELDPEARTARLLWSYYEHNWEIGRAHV